MFSWMLDWNCPHYLWLWIGHILGVKFELISKIRFQVFLFNQWLKLYRIVEWSRGRKTILLMHYIHTFVKMYVYWYFYNMQQSFFKTFSFTFIFIHFRLHHTNISYIFFFLSLILNKCIHLLLYFLEMSYAPKYFRNSNFSNVMWQESRQIKFVALTLNS